jgi:hypothetical protein
MSRLGVTCRPERPTVSATGQPKLARSYAERWVQPIVNTAGAAVLSVGLAWE